MRREFAVGIFDGEVLLVVAHHGHQDLFGQVQVLRLKIAEDYRWPLGEMHDSLDQCLILTPARAGNGARHLVQSFTDRLPPLGHIHDDFRLTHRFWISLRHAITTGASPCSTRWPRLALPAVMPAISSGTTAESSSATTQRTGRTNRSGLPARQYMFLAQ